MSRYARDLALAVLTVYALAVPSTISLLESDPAYQGQLSPGQFLLAAAAMVLLPLLGWIHSPWLFLPLILILGSLVLAARAAPPGRIAWLVVGCFSWLISGFLMLSFLVI